MEWNGMDGWVDGRVDGWMDRWLDGWMGGWMDNKSRLNISWFSLCVAAISFVNLPQLLSTTV